jgi:ribosomal protein S18 acetylase RimI-like enzyme
MGIKASVVLKAVADGLLLGSVRAQATNGIVQLGRLIVASTAQRQGLGSALLRAIELEFPTGKRFELFTGSRSDGNIRLYRKHGYVLTHQRVLSSSVILVFMSKSNETATQHSPSAQAP